MMGARNLRHILNLADFVSNLRPTIHIKSVSLTWRSKCVQAITDGLSGQAVTILGRGKFYHRVERFGRRVLLSGLGCAGVRRFAMYRFPSKSFSVRGRRSFLQFSALGGAATMLPALGSLENPGTANGSPDPYPIPWLDKNGSHNQPAGPNLEPSHIYHFKGLVARCSTFTGMGTDNQGNRIAFGSPTTDYGVMKGEYWAARSAQQGAFTHI